MSNLINETKLDIPNVKTSHEPSQLSTSPHSRQLKKQITYSYGMKLEQLTDNNGSENHLNQIEINRLHRCREIENLTEEQKYENDELRLDDDALHSKTHLKRTHEFENLSEANLANNTN